MTTSCEQCDATQRELVEARSRIVELEGQVGALETQLTEAMKLVELQKAELERYRKVIESNRPNHPERVPVSHLQLAFERVVETLGTEAGVESPANDVANGGETSAAPADPDALDAAETGSEGAGNGEADTGKPATGRNDPEKKGEGKNRHSHGRRKLDMSNLPVVEQRIEPPEVVEAGGEGYVLIGMEISERVAQRPAEMIRYRLIRPKYVLASSLVAAQKVDESTATVEERDENAETSATAESEAPTARAETAALCLEPRPCPTVYIAPLPDGVWPHVMADPSVIANVILSKYGDLLPLNRQQAISARRGFVLPKSTQCGWLKEAYSYCFHVVDAMMEDARKNAFLIATDATGVSVLPPRRGPPKPSNESGGPPEPSSESGAPEPSNESEDPLGLGRRSCEPWHLFVFIADRDHVVFRYDRKHTGAVFQNFLSGFHGNLLADAASVFDVLYRDHGMIENGCWFHARRPFYRALEADPERALEALSLINGLFAIERELRAEGLDLESFTRRRAERSKPILGLLDAWVALHEKHADPRGPLDAGIGYYKNQREALHRFLHDGRIRLDNNLSEQALRNVVVGEANWIFFANETGVRWYTVFRSLIASCALHGLNPEIYLEQLLRILPHWPKSRVLELAPKYWRKTVEALEPRWRAMLARPWEPDVELSAELVSPKTSVPKTAVARVTVAA